jgi:hypothetical protein
MRPPAHRLLTTAAVLLPLAAAGADQLSLPAAKDNTLYFDAEGDVSNGSGSHMFTGRNGQGIVRRTVIAFDLSALPDGAVITAATLRLNLSSGDATSRATSVHRLLSDWGEGASDAPDAEGQGTLAAPGDATWLHTFFSSALWATPGGDFDPAVRAVTGVAGPGVYTWSSPDLAADVQSWLDNPATNFGWLLRGNETVNNSAKRFDSLQNPNLDARPTLIVEYTPVPAPGVAALLLLAGGAPARRRR